jgi:hypothetical protein
MFFLCAFLIFRRNALFLVNCLFEYVSFSVLSLPWLLVSRMKLESYLNISSSDDVTV